MGSPKHLRKLSEKPKKVWDATRIEEESKLVAEYGLRNMRELWRMKTILRKIRRSARRLLATRGGTASREQEALVARVKSFIIRGESTLDGILALTTKDILERRLQTVVLRKGFANTVAQSRQLITHGHIAIDGQKTTAPSRLVAFGEETKLAWFGKPVEVNKTEKTETEEKAPEPEAKEVVANA